MNDRRWRVSSYSGNQGNCVEVTVGDATRVRDTKRRDAGHLTVHADGWSAFLGALKADQLDA